MTGFNLDFSKASEMGGVKDGSYEVIVNRANEDATPGGSEYIELDLVIRNDVEQPYQNAHVFAKIWKAKATGVYNEGMINNIAKHLQLENGKQYNGLEELLADFVFKTCLITVRNEESESNGKKYNNLNVRNWDFTNTQGVSNHQFKKGEEPSFGPTGNSSPFGKAASPVQDKDLPF